MARPVPVAAMIDSQKMNNQHVPIVFDDFGVQVFLDPFVDRVQIPNVETRKRIVPVESSREQVGPRVVAHEHDLLAVVDQLIDHVIFHQLFGREIRTDVDERGQTARGKGGQPLHGGGRRVGNELVQPRPGRVARQHVPEHGDLVGVRGVLVGADDEIVT